MTWSHFKRLSDFWKYVLTGVRYYRSDMAFDIMCA